MKTSAAITRAAVALAAAFVVTLAVTLVACNRPNNDTAVATPPLPVAKVRLAEARAIEEVRRIELSGTVRAVDSAQLAPKIMGAVESMPVTLGQRVKKGDLLVKLSAGEINAKLAQAETGLAQATRDLERERGLLAKNASTAETVRNLEDRRRIAQAMVDEARVMLGYTTIAAPFDGVVTRKFASEGDLATPGHPLLALENPARLRVEIDVPESFAPLAVGSTVPLRITGTSSEESRFQGRLAEMAPASDPATRTLTAKIDLPVGADAVLHPGQFAKVAWPASDEKSVMLVVPVAAVTLFGQMERVFVMDGDGRASLRIVKTGAKQNAMVEILAGLTAGEKVVIEGAATLRDGQPLEEARP